MSAPDEVLAYLRTLLWPGVAVAALVVFRRQLAGLIPRLREVSAVGASVTFADQAGALADDACAQLQTVASRGGMPAPKPGDLLPPAPVPVPGDVFRHAYAELEAAAREAAEQGAVAAADPVQLLRELTRRGQVPDAAVRIAGELRRIRNEITHGTRRLEPADAENLTIAARALAAVCRIAAQRPAPAGRDCPPADTGRSRRRPAALMPETRPVTGRDTEMDTEDTDVVVIGLGVGGEEAAGRLAEAGLHVTGIENRLVGGECPYWACIPSKMMIRAANLLAEVRRVPGMAGAATAVPDWAPVARRIREEATDNWNDKVAVDRFTGKGGHFVRGRATIAGRKEVTVTTSEDATKTFRARRGIVIATGTDPAVPPIPGLAGTPFWTNRDAAGTEHVPQSLIVLGGGPVGAELAQVFARFGARVTVIEALPRLLPLAEPEASDLLKTVFAREGIGVRTGAPATRVSHDGRQFAVQLNGETLTAEQLLVATGRRTSLKALGVAGAGLDPDARTIRVDERMRATDGLWAIGDITGVSAYTHMAMYQADIAVRDILGEPGPAADYRAVPGVTFTDPEIGQAGLTEAQARERGINVRTGITQVPSSARGWIHKAGNDGFIKLIADAGRDVLVGATSAGPAGGEVLGALVVAIHGQVPVSKLKTMIYAYPTFHRAIEDAVRNLGAA